MATAAIMVQMLFETPLIGFFGEGDHNDTKSLGQMQELIQERICLYDITTISYIRIDNSNRSIPFDHFNQQFFHDAYPLFDNAYLFSYLFHGFLRKSPCLFSPFSHNREYIRFIHSEFFVSFTKWGEFSHHHLE